MQHKTLVVSDHTHGIPFASILHLYHPHLVTLADVEQVTTDDYSLAVLDIPSLLVSKQVINRLRQNHPSLPVLVILDYDLPFDTDFFTQIDGFGSIKVLDWKSSYPDRLLEAVENILHPEYPSIHSRIAVVLPVYNEAERFHHVDNFLSHLQTLVENGYMHICVYLINDGSNDETQQLVDRFTKRFLANTKTIHHCVTFSSITLEQNTRKAGIYIESLRQIHADTFLFVDADNSFTIEDISMMLNVIHNGYYDIVVGTKDHISNRLLSRKILSFGKRILTRPLLPAGVKDSQTGLKVMNAVAARYLLPYLQVSTGLAIDLQMLYVAKKFNFRVRQLPVTCMDREGSHVDIWRDSIHFLKSLVRIRRSFNQMIKRRRSW